jgi:hypothetical protein
MNARKQNIMRAPYDYFPSLRSQVQDVTGETNARVVRAILQDLVAEGYLAKTRMQVVSSLGATAPAYFGTRKGAEYLAAEVDERYLHSCTQTPNPHHLLHWVGLSEIKIRFDKAAARQTQASVRPWLAEWDVANPEEAEPEKRFRLYTLFPGEKRKVCNPDSGFVLRVGPHAKAYLVELDRHTTSLTAICASKNPGYMELARVRGHQRIFPGTADAFTVLSVSLTPGRRDLLRKTMRTWLKAQAEKHKGAVGEQFLGAVKLWKFAALSELTAETALYGAIWHPCEGEPSPLVKLPGPAHAVAPAGGPGVSPPRTFGRT